MTFSADGRFAYVVGELDVTVRVLAWDAGVGTLVQTLPATTVPADGAPAAVARRPRRRPAAGRRAVVGRARAVPIRPDGLLEPVADDALPGAWPRHLDVVDGWTVVAEQVSSGLAVLAPDGTVVSTLALPSPTCVLPA